MSLIEHLESPVTTDRHIPLPAPLPDGVAPFAFAVIADPHCTEAPKVGADREGDNVERFLRCIELAREIEPAPDFILAIGDVHLWGLEAVLADLPVPLHLIAGNHEGAEARAEMRAAFPEDFVRDGEPSDYYAFRHKGVHFIGMCNAGGRDHIGHLCSEDITPAGQCEWLEQELAADDPVKVLFGHVPPHPEGADVMHFMGRNDSRFLNDLIRHTSPTVAFFGHQHLPTRVHMAGSTPCYTLASCAWNTGTEHISFQHVTVGPAEMVVREVPINR
jgi:hypothetical protein